MMPVVGTLKTKAETRASAFRHEQEIAEPAYYAVHLDEEGVFAELTALSRSALLQFTFE